MLSLTVFIITLSTRTSIDVDNATEGPSLIEELAPGLEAACPDEVAACVANDECNSFLVASLQSEKEPSAEESAANDATELVACIKRGPLTKPPRQGHMATDDAGEADAENSKLPDRLTPEEERASNEGTFAFVHGNMFNAMFPCFLSFLVVKEIRFPPPPSFIFSCEV